MLRLFIFAIVQLFLLVSVAANTGIFELGKRHFQTAGSADQRLNSNNTITEIISDNQGFLWIGTFNGLIRYDGYQFVTYTYDAQNPETIGGNFIRSLWVAKDDKIWIGTMSGGLSVFNPDTEKFTRFTHDKNDPNSLSHNRIEAVVGDNEGGIWIGTNEGLDFLNTKTNQITHYRTDSEHTKGLNDNHIRALLIDHQSNLWIGTWNGINRLKKNAQFFESIHSDKHQETTLAGKNISFLFEDKQHKLWIGTARNGAAWIDNNNQLKLIPADTSRKDRLPHPWVDGIIQPNPDEIWMATYGGGIAVINVNNGKVIEHIRHDPSVNSSINLDSLGAIWQDPSGIVWVGTWGDGLNKLNPASDAIRTFKNSSYTKQSLGNYDLISLKVMQNGDVWLGSSSNGIGVLAPKSGTVTPLKDITQVPNELINSTISSIGQSKDGIIWIGSQQSGLFKYTPQTQTFKNYGFKHGLTSRSVRHMFFESEQKIWLGTDKGIFLFNPQNESFQHINLINNSQKKFLEPVLDIEVQNDRTVWIATENGLYFIPSNQQEVFLVKTDYQSSSQLNHHNIRALYLDENNTLWITTELGLSRLVSMQNNNPIFEKITLNSESTVQTPLTSIQPDNLGRLWGVEGYFDPHKHQWNSLDNSDGIDILSWIGSHSKTDDGTLLFGGTKGLLLINPEKFKPWTFEPATVITSLKLNGIKQKGKTLTSLKIPSAIKSFTIEFSSLDYSAPQNNQYAYQLVGYDTDWITTDYQYRIASYTNIDPGNYQLKIKGTNKNGVWSRKIVNLPIQILPAWYQTYWFRGLVLIIACTLLYLLYVVRVKHLQTRKIELSLEVKARTTELLIMGKIGRELNSLLDKKSIFDKLYKHITSIVDTYVFAIGLLDSDGKNIVFKLGYENGKPMPEHSVPLTEESKCAVWCVNHSSEIFMKTKEEVSRYIKGVPQATTGNLMESVIYIPLFNRENRIIGCITIQSPIQEAYSAEQHEIFRTLASYTAIAIDNANAYQKVEKTNKELKKAYEKLQEISTTDHLTGLKNRRYLINQIDKDTAKSLRDYNIFNQTNKSFPDESDLIFYILDLDHFKKINDIYGHAAGDAVLIEVKGLLEQVFRSSDYLVRWGGEEFLIVARFSNRKMANCLAERLRVSIEEHSFDIGNNKTIRVTGSIGFSCYPLKTQFPKESNWLQIIDIADKCLYAAKKTSRNAWIGVEVTQKGQAAEIQNVFLKSPEQLINSNNIQVLSSYSDKKKIIWN